jgi:hypothetical protein
MAIQKTQKMVMMGCINFKDETLIKIRWASKKMNVMGKKLKDEKTWGNRRKLFSFVVESCERFQSS